MTHDAWFSQYIVGTTGNMLDNNWHDEFLEYRRNTTDSPHSAATKFLWSKVSEIVARAESAEAKLAEVEKENKGFRAMLYWAHSKGRGYHDDGELQDRSAKPEIDWKRDSFDVIHNALDKRARAELEAEEITPALLFDAFKTGKPLLSRAELSAKLAALEAQCAGMREAYTKVVERLRSGSWRMSEVKELAEAVLECDSGTHLLARLRELEAVYTAAHDALCTKYERGSKGGEITYRGKLATANIQKLYAALAKVAQQQGEANV